MRSLTINVIRAIHQWLQRTLANLIWKQIDHLHASRKKADETIEHAKKFAAAVEKDCTDYKERCADKAAALLKEVAEL